MNSPFPYRPQAGVATDSHAPRRAVSAFAAPSLSQGPGSPVRAEGGERRTARHSPKAAYAALSIGLALLAAATYWSLREAVSRSVQHRLEATAALKARAATSWIEDIRKDIKVWTESPHFFRAMEDWRSGGPRDSAARQRLLEFLSMLSKTSQYADVGVRDATTGALLLTTREESDSETERDEAKLAVEASSPLFEVIHRHGEHESAYLDYFAAVTLPVSGDRLVVEVDIDLRRELVPLIEHRADDRVGKSAEVQLTRREGDAMVVLNKPAGRPGVLPTDGPRIDAQLLRGTLGFLRGDDARGEPVLAFAQPVAGTSWVLVASIGEAEAFAELNEFALLIAASGVSLFVVGSLWWRELHRRRAAELGQQRERAEQGQRLTELSRRVVSVQEEERRRLASELHDRTGANLATIKLNLKSIARTAPAPSTDTDALMHETHELLADTIVSIREFCSDLRPSILDYAGLQRAIENLVDGLVRRAGIQGKVDHAKFSGRCSADIESVLFRIVQEALLNCAKHAQARKVSVCLKGDCRNLVMTIEDDGIGFDPQALSLPGRNAGNGLLGMHERAAFAGGTFAIESAPGKGTRITIEI